jgi:hypothetical protein
METPSSDWTAKGPKRGHFATLSFDKPKGFEDGKKGVHILYAFDNNRIDKNPHSLNGRVGEILFSFLRAGGKTKARGRRKREQSKRTIYS